MDTRCVALYARAPHIDPITTSDPCSSSHAGAGRPRGTVHGDRSGSGGASGGPGARGGRRHRLPAVLRASEGQGTFHFNTITCFAFTDLPFFLPLGPWRRSCCRCGPSRIASLTRCVPCLTPTDALRRRVIVACRCPMQAYLTPSLPAGSLSPPSTTLVAGGSASAASS